MRLKPKAKSASPPESNSLKASTGGQPAAASSPWEPVLERASKVVLELTVDPKNLKAIGARRRKLKLSREFTDWLDSRGYTPDSRPLDVLSEFLVAQNIPVDGRRSILQKFIKASALLVLTEEDNMRNNRPLPQRVAPPPAPVEVEGLADDDEDDEPEEGEDTYPPEDEAPRRKTARHAQAMAQPPVYVVQPGTSMPTGYPPGYFPAGFVPAAPFGMGRPRGRPSTNPNYRAPPQSAVSKLLPKNDKIRVWKRTDGGRRTFVQDYTVDEIGGGSLPKFLKEYVAPTYGDPSGTTVFEVFEVGPDDKERGQPSSITIETEPTDGGHDPLQPARSALNFIEDVRQLEEQRRGHSQEMLDEFKRKAVGSGDMNQMMMLLMMERMMGGSGGSPEQLALKLVERLQQGAGGAAVAPPSIPMGPPPSSALDKVVEALLANSLKPAPPPKTLIEQMGELKMLMSVLSPPVPVAPVVPPELITLLSRMNEKLDKPRGGLEEAVGTFDRLKNIVKTLAPEVNAGGVTGALQSILTPELGRALGNAVASGIEKTKELQRPPEQSAVAIPTAPVPTTATPTAETPPPIRDAAKKLAEERDETKAQGALVELLQAMYAEPSLAKRLDEPLGMILAGNYTPARETLKEILLSAQRADLTTPIFIDRALALLITRAGGVPPAALLHQATVTPIRPPDYIPSVAESEALEKIEREATAKERAAKDAPTTQPSNIA